MSNHTRWPNGRGKPIVCNVSMNWKFVERSLGTEETERVKTAITKDGVWISEHARLFRLSPEEMKEVTMLDDPGASDGHSFKETPVNYREPAVLVEPKGSADPVDANVTPGDRWYQTTKPIYSGNSNLVPLWAQIIFWLAVIAIIIFLVAIL